MIEVFISRFFNKQKAIPLIRVFPSPLNFYKQLLLNNLRILTTLLLYNYRMIGS